MRIRLSKHTVFSLLALMLVLGGGSYAMAQQQTAPQTPADPKAADKYAPDIQPQALWDGRKIMPFRALDAPPMVAAADASFLDDSDYVLGITVHGESRAYPTRFLWWHHVINDTVGKDSAGGPEPVSVTYCSVCNTGIRYDPRLKDHSQVKLDFYGLYNGIVALYDRNTETVFLQGSGEAVKGPLVGVTLKSGPVLDTTWKQWKKLHPDTLVMSPDTPYSRYYSPRDKPEPRGYDRFPAPFFRPTVTRGDKRLPPFDKVLAVTLTDEKATDATTLRRAYPIKTLQEADGVINDTLGKTPVAALLDLESVAATAVSRILDDKTLTFEARKQPDGKSAIYDKETGTRWNIEGIGEEGPLKGKTLSRLDNHLSQWYGWAAYFPDTSIYGRNDPPQPGNPFEAQPAPVARPDKP